MPNVRLGGCFAPVAPPGGRLPLPGLGRLVFQAIGNRDLPLVQDIVMLLALLVIAINFVVDVLYAVIDPRLKGHAT